MRHTHENREKCRKRGVKYIQIERDRESKREFSKERQEEKQTRQNAWLLSSKMLFPNVKAFVCTDAKTPNSKLLKEAESNLQLQYLC